jgi:hypothetical protein
MLILVGALLIAGSAAADECGARRSDILILKDWSAATGEYNNVRVSLNLQNNTNKQIRMVKASAVFTDPFGENIASLAIDPDVVIPAKGAFEEKGSWSAARLVKVRKQDVKATMCVSAVLYEDGSKEQFQ